MKFLKTIAAFCAAVMLTGSAALAQEYDAQQAKSWMEQFAQALDRLAPINDPAQTLDPARPGEYLQEYEFGTVQATTSDRPTAAQIEEIDVSTAQVTDARGVRVGMSLGEALGGLSIPQTEANLAVLSTQEAGVGWCWAYLGEGEVYGVEWLTYDLTEPVTEYTLTYVIDGDTVSGIRVKAAASTQAQAEAGLATAQEIAGRQQSAAVLAASSASIFGEEDLTVNGSRVLGAEAYALVQALGEPNEVQTLPAGGGRILLYDGAAVQLELNEATGAEVVRGVTATGGGLTGPRGLTVGMTAAESAGRFHCDADVYASGGVLYMEGKAYGEPPFADMTATQNGEATIRYVCRMADGEDARLDVGIQNEQVSYWHLYIGEEAADGE